MKNITLMLVTTLTLFANSISFENRQDFFIPNNSNNEYEIFSFSSQKDKFITGKVSGNLLLWSLKSGLPIKDFGELGYIRSAKQSQDKRYMLIHSSLDYNDSVKLLDTQKEKLDILASKSQVEGSSYRTDISKDGKYLIFTEGDCDQNMIKVWDIKEGKVRNTFSTHTPDLLQTLISPKNSFIATIARERVFSLWSMKGKQLFKTKLPKKKGYRQSYSLNITPDEKYVLVGKQLFDVEKKQMMNPFKSKIGLTIYSTTKNNELIVHAEGDRNITFWDINRSSPIDYLSDSEGNISIISELDNSKRYFTCRISLHSPIEKGGSVKRGKTKLLDSKKHQLFYYPSANNYAFDKNLMAWSDINKTIHIMNIDENRERMRFNIEKAISISSAVISKDGKYIASLGEGMVSVWDIEQDKLLYSFKEGNDTMFNVVLFTSTGEHLLVLNSNKIDIYDVKKGTHLKTIETQKEYMSSNEAYLILDDKYLIIDDSEETFIWSFEKNSFIKSDFRLSQIPQTSFSHQNSYAITFPDEFSIKLYDLKQIEKPIKEFMVGNKGNWAVFNYQEKKIHRSSHSFIFRKDSDSLKLELLEN